MSTFPNSLEESKRQIHTQIEEEEARRVQLRQVEVLEDINNRLGILTVTVSGIILELSLANQLKMAELTGPSCSAEIKQTLKNYGVKAKELQDKLP